MPRRRNYPLTSLINKKGCKNLHKYCFFCGEDDYNALHCHRILPGEDGGTYHAQNILTVCASCHCKIHSGKIKIDRKYPQLAGALYKVHYWIDEEEFWRDEELGMFTSNPRCHHSGLGSSKKVTKKRQDVSSSDSDQTGSE
jgi:hypothetical protein